jgi:hypothetical protein
MLRLPIDSPYSSFLPPAAGSSHAFFQAHVAAVCVLRACCVRVCVRSLQLFLFAAPTLFADAVLDRCASLTHRPQGAAMGVSLLAACAALPHRCTASRALLLATVHAVWHRHSACAAACGLCQMECALRYGRTRMVRGLPANVGRYAIRSRFASVLSVVCSCPPTERIVGRAMCSAKRCEASDDDSDAGTSEGSCDESP